jgi:hypothetical protein
MRCTEGENPKPQPEVPVRLKPTEGVPMAQQAFVLWFSEDHNNLGDLNNLLGQGLRVRRATAMSGTGETGPETPQSQFPYSRAAVVLSDDDGRDQQAFVLWFGDTGSTSLPQLNALLAQDWEVAQLYPMSGTGERGPETPQSAWPYSRALAILERH